MPVASAAGAAEPAAAGAGFASDRRRFVGAAATARGQSGRHWPPRAVAPERHRTHADGLGRPEAQAAPAGRGGGVARRSPLGGAAARVGPHQAPRLPGQADRTRGVRGLLVQPAVLGRAEADAARGRGRLRRPGAFGRPRLDRPCRPSPERLRPAPAGDRLGPQERHAGRVQFHRHGQGQQARRAAAGHPRRPAQPPRPDAPGPARRRCPRRRHCRADSGSQSHGAGETSHRQAR